jgi:hypothetical protein
MTVITEPWYSTENYKAGDTGYIQLGIFYNVVNFRKASNCWYQRKGHGHIFYCICKSTAQRRLIYEGWIGSFAPSVWLGILITILAVSILVACKSSKTPKTKTSFAFLFKKHFLVSVFDVLSLFLRQGKLKKNLLILLSTFIAAILLASYENFMTSGIITPEPPKHHTLNSLMEAGYNLLYDMDSSRNIVKQILEEHMLKSNIKYHTQQIKLGHASAFISMKAMDTNNTQYLSYFGWHSDIAGKAWLGRMQLYNKGCNCFILKDGFHEVPTYIDINHFLRSRFQRTLNRLQEDGLFSFFERTCPDIAHSLEKNRIRRRLSAKESVNSNSDYSIGAEFGSTDYIGSPGLNVIFYSLIFWSFFWTVLFFLAELNYFVAFVCCAKQALSKRNLRWYYYKLRLEMFALIRYLNR